MDPFVRELVAALNARFETFAHLNEKTGRSYRFEIEQIDGASLDEALSALYSDEGATCRTTRVARPRAELAAALQHWLFQFLDPAEIHLSDPGSDFYFSDPTARADYAKGIADSLLQTIQPDAVHKVRATFPDDDEAERLEYALVTQDCVYLVHLGVRHTDTPTAER